MEFSNEKWDDVSKLEVQSDTKLEQDTGTGQTIVIRCFEFAANPEAFKKQKPTKQQLFESHKKFIEAFLWKDGLRPHEGMEARVIINKRKTKYRIFVGAEARNNQWFIEQPQTLSQLAQTHEPRPATT